MATGTASSESLVGEEGSHISQKGIQGNQHRKPFQTKHVDENMSSRLHCNGWAVDVLHVGADSEERKKDGWRCFVKNVMTFCIM